MENIRAVHGEGALDVDFSTIARCAEQVRLVDSKTRRFDWERTSNRQQRRVRTGGIVGTVPTKAN